MSGNALDDVDRGLLHFLQRDARNSTSTEMGEALGIAASTVRNRLDRLEGAGIVTGYVPVIDYDAAGYPLQVLFTATAPEEPPDVGRQVLEREGVVAVRELLAGSEDLRVEAVGSGTRHVARIADDLGDLGVEIVRTDVLETRHRQPFDHFGDDVVDEKGPG